MGVHARVEVIDQSWIPSFITFHFIFETGFLTGSSSLVGQQTPASASVPWDNRCVPHVKLSVLMLGI